MTVRTPLFALSLVLAMSWSTMTAATDTPVRGGPGGTPFRFTCDKGAYLVGMRARMGDWVDQLRPVCAPWLPERRRFGATSVGIAIGDSKGGNRDIPGTCFPGFAISRLDGTLVVGNHAESKFVGGLSVHCQTAEPPVARHALDFGYALSFGATSTPTFDLDCPSGELAVGLHGRSGLFVDALGLVCAPAPAKLGFIEASQAKTMSSALPTAPTINSPKAWVVKGKGVFRITPSPHLAGTQAHVQLRWLNPPDHLKGKGVDFYQYTSPMSLIAGPAGIDAPDIYLSPGTWEMRVRVNEPKVGDWSDWKRFEYYLQSPAAASASKAAQRGAAAATREGSAQTPGGATMLNPQPLPPRTSGAATKRSEAVQLNPQPLPPKQSPFTRPETDPIRAGTGAPMTARPATRAPAEWADQAPASSLRR
jgi:hypothetical protein